MSHNITNLEVGVWEDEGIGKGGCGLQFVKDAKAT